VAVVGVLPELPAGETVDGRATPSDAPRRRMYLGGWTEVPVYALERLAAGHTVAGPALFEAPTTTVLARAGDRVTVTPHGWLDITV
jgi:N-methylhydantoinase A